MPNTDDQSITTSHENPTADSEGQDTTTTAKSLPGGKKGGKNKWLPFTEELNPYRGENGEVQLQSSTKNGSDLGQDTMTTTIGPRPEAPTPTRPSSVWASLRKTNGARGSNGGLTSKKSS